MKTLSHPTRIFFLLVALASCTNASPPTQVVIPTDLAFSNPLIAELSQAGLSILSVQSSTYMAMFPSTDQAVWIKTDEGVVEAIFFADPVEVQRLHVLEQPDEKDGRHRYTLQAPPPTLLHDQTIDAAYPLYFLIKKDMLIVTSSEELDKTLQHILSGQ